MIFEPALFGVVLKSFLLAFLVFIGLFLAAEYGIQHLPQLHWRWVNDLIAILTPVLFIALAFLLGAPMAAIFASLYLNAIARKVEAKYYAADAPSKGAPFFESIVVGLRLFGWIVIVTLALLPVDVAVPVAGSLATLAVNGWLLGREYFELAALRHLPKAKVDAMRKRHAASILGAGIVIAGLAEIPLVDFMAPLFGAAFMVHIFKFYQHREARA